MNPRTRQAALHAIAAIAILASLNALAHSYAGLYQWAAHHHLTGWQALTWPAEIDVFLIIGELALYVAYLVGWPARHKLWPWTTALIGLAVSVAGNIGHISASTAHPVPLVDRLTAATSPLAAFAGLAVALLVLKQTTRPSTPWPWPPNKVARGVDPVPGTKAGACRVPVSGPMVRLRLPANGYGPAVHFPLPAISVSQPDDEPRIVQDARELRTEYERRGTSLSRRQLATQLRARGHTLANARVRELADAIDLP